MTIMAMARYIRLLSLEYCAPSPPKKAKNEMRMVRKEDAFVVKSRNTPMDWEIEPVYIIPKPK